MDFTFTEKQLELKRSMVEFAEKELCDDLVSRDKAAAFSRDLWNKCADFGIPSLPFPREYGGLGEDLVTTALVMEGLGYACRDNGLIFGINAQILSVQMPILGFGSEEQKARYLPKLCSGEWIGAHAMSEPESGSDAFSLSTSAVRRGDHYLLNGVKTFVTNAPVADVFVVFATVDKRKGFMGVTAFVVERDFPGLWVGADIGKMGLKTAPLAQVYFQDCPVPEANRLGREGNGAAIFSDSMEWERSCILASQIGSMERQLEDCLEYAKSRQQFNSPIGKFQSVANKLVDMKVRLETARLMLYKGVWAKQHNQPHASTDIAIAKLYVSEARVQSSLDAIQVHGGYGYTTECEVERELRDSVAGTLYSGTSEIQRNIIAGQMGL